jgi:hypothetical protein
MPYITKYIEIRTNKQILEEYDAYIEGLYERKTKPWLMSKDEGITIINGNDRACYTWTDVKEDVKRLKILKRKYYQSPLTLDEQIWQSFKSIGIDIWDMHKDTYGIQTVDDNKLDWNSFKELVENASFIETPERIAFIQQFEQEFESGIEKNENMECETDWYEEISQI